MALDFDQLYSVCDTYLCKEYDSLELVGNGKIKVEDEERCHHSEDTDEEEQNDSTRDTVLAAKPQVKTRTISILAFTA